MDKKSVLVTGGGGFLGSHLCESLLESGFRVYCLDNFGSGCRDNIAHLIDQPDFSVITGDVRSLPELPSVDEVYHLASRASPADFTDFPVQIAETNTKGTKKLLEYSVEEDAKMLYASTSEVYGDPNITPQPESYNGSVNIRGPRGCYDEAKRFGETLTVAYEKEYDVDVRTVRIFNTYGPRMRTDDGRVVPNFLTQALTDKDITVYGDGTQTRSFCYVSDTISGLREVMNTSCLKGDVVNIGKANEITINELAEIIIEITDTKSEIIFEDLPEDDPKRRCPNLEKTLSKLDWSPKIPLKEGLEQTRDYFNHKLDTSIVK